MVFIKNTLETLQTELKSVFNHNELKLVNFKLKKDHTFFHLNVTKTF